MSKKDASQKFFNIQFTNDEGEVKTTKVPARKGKNLKDALEGILTSHSLSFDTHSVFLDTSKTPLPQTIDTFPFGGHTLHVKANEDIQVDERIKTLMREESRKSHDIGKRYSELLDHFDTYGFDGFEDDVIISDVADSTDGCAEENSGVTTDLDLEESWTDVVTSVGENEEDKRLRVQQQAIWELFTTEVGFIKDMQIVIQVFKKCLLNLKKEGYLLEVDEYSIFANVEQVYEVNVTFWKALKPALEEARKTNEPFNPKRLVQAFDNFEELFQPYIEFCNEDTSNKKYLVYTEQTNDLLKQYLAWCDNHQLCMRLKLAGFLIKPLQRVTKYTLLLRAIISKTDDPDDLELLEDMKSRVETFVSKINKAVHLRQEHEKFTSVVQKFDSYNAVEAYSDEVEKLITEYSTLDLNTPIPGLCKDSHRFLLKEARMKIVEKQGKKEVTVFLFTDSIVVAKYKKATDKYKVVRPPYRLARVTLRVLRDPQQFLFVYKNEYDVICSGFVLQSTTPEEREKWRNTIEEAKKSFDTMCADYAKESTTPDDEKTTSFKRRHVVKKDRRGVSSSQDDVISNGLDALSDTRLIIGAILFCILNAIVSKWL